MRILLALLFSVLLAHTAASAQTSKFGIPTGHTPNVGAIQLPATTVNQLPLCDVYNLGIHRYAIDLTTPTYGAVAVGGGAVKGSVSCNGVNWVTP